MLRYYSLTQKVLLVQIGVLRHTIRVYSHQSCSSVLYSYTTLLLIQTSMVLVNYPSLLIYQMQLPQTYISLIQSNINKDDMLIEMSPKFIWILRDFILEKVHPETGVELSSQEYLEMCLRRKVIFYKPDFRKKF